MNIGDKVVFDIKVYKHLWAPYFNKYINYVFQIESFRDNDTVELKCISDKSVIVDGCVFADCIIPIEH